MIKPGPVPILLVPIGLVFLVVSALTLGVFPHLNPEEVSIAATADYARRTGEIFYPVFLDVIHPDFELFSGAAQEGLRGVYIWMLGFVQTMFGTGFVPLRALSWLGWLLSGITIFVLVDRNMGRGQALLSILLWFLSFDGLLASHLIRPESWLGLASVGVFYLLLKGKKPPLMPGWKVPAAGLFSGCALGLHPHGMVVLALAGILIFFTGDDGWKKKFSVLVRFSLGLLGGLLLFAASADVPGFVLSRYTVAMGTFDDLSRLWFERLNPLNGMADLVFVLSRPNTFYLAQDVYFLELWKSAGVYTFSVTLFTICWAFLSRKKSPMVPALLLAAGFMWVAIGYGHLRTELIYNIPITVFMVPLAAYVLFGSWKQLSGPFLPSAALVLSVVFVSWVFRYSMIFYLVLLAATLNLEKVSNRGIVLSIGAGLLFLFSMWLRNPGAMKDFSAMNMESLASPVGVVLVVIALAGFVYSSRNVRKNRVLPLVKLAVLGWALMVTTTSSLTHFITVSYRFDHPSTSIEKARALIGNKESSVLGPGLFWFSHGDKFRSLSALVNDYYYSGQKRPWEGIKRFKPDILITDQEFRKRFLLHYDGRNKTYSLKPMNSVLKVPFTFLGSIPRTSNHTHLELFKLHWPHEQKI